MSNGQKWLLSLMCVCIMAIPFVLLILPEKSTKNIEKTDTEIKKSVPTPTPGIFIIPQGGKEVSRDTAGQRFFPKNVGEIVKIYTINPKNPAHLFFLNESGKKILIDPGLTRIRITDIGKKSYISFANYGKRTAEIRVPRHY